MDGELAGPLLGGDDVQLWREGRNRYHRLARQVRPRHCQLQVLCAPCSRQYTAMGGSKLTVWTGCSRRNEGKHSLEYLA